MILFCFSIGEVLQIFHVFPIKMIQLFYHFFFLNFSISIKLWLIEFSLPEQEPMRDFLMEDNHDFNYEFRQFVEPLELKWKAV